MISQICIWQRSTSGWANYYRKRNSPPGSYLCHSPCATLFYPKRFTGQVLLPEGRLRLPRLWSKADGVQESGGDVATIEFRAYLMSVIQRNGPGRVRQQERPGVAGQRREGRPKKDLHLPLDGVYVDGDLRVRRQHDERLDSLGRGQGVWRKRRGERTCTEIVAVREMDSPG